MTDIVPLAADAITADLLKIDPGTPLVSFDEIGYDGPVTAEMMPPYAHFPERMIEATSNAMDAILGR